MIPEMLLFMMSYTGILLVAFFLFNFIESSFSGSGFHWPLIAARNEIKRDRSGVNED